MADFLELALLATSCGIEILLSAATTMTTMDAPTTSRRRA